MKSVYAHGKNYTIRPAVFKLGSAIYDPYVFKFAHISQSLSLSALRGSVAVVWHDRLSVDVSY